MVNAHSLPARILANVAIWGILVVGAFFVFVFKDYTIGFELAILSLGKSSRDQDLGTLLTTRSSSTCPAGHTCPCASVDIRICYHELSNSSVGTDWRAWNPWRGEQHQT